MTTQTSLLRQTFLLIRNECRLLGRSAETLVSVFFFTFLIILIFQFGFDLKGLSPVPYVTPFVWMATLFGGMLRMGRTFEFETKGRVLEALRMVDGIAVPFFISKWLVNLLFLIILEAGSFLAVLLLFNLPSPGAYLATAWPSLALGALGLASLGTAFSGMLRDESHRDLLLPVMAYPIMVPLVVGVMKALVYNDDGILISLNSAWIWLMVGFDVIYFLLSLLVFDLLLES